MTNIDVLALISDADIVVKAVILVLILFSVISWEIMIKKSIAIRRASKNTQKFINFFWSQSDLDHAFAKAKKTKNCPAAQMFKAAYQEYKRGTQVGNESFIKDLTKVDQIERVLERSKQKELSTLEDRIPFLATAGSSAPFIGLFCTVWGIMNSFINIGQMGSTNLAVVAPGIAEALIATAIGLFAAIPAVIGYNFCNTRLTPNLPAHYFPRLQLLHLFSA